MEHHGVKPPAKLIREAMLKLSAVNKGWLDVSAEEHYTQLPQIHIEPPKFDEHTPPRDIPAEASQRAAKIIEQDVDNDAVHGMLTMLDGLDI